MGGKIVEENGVKFLVFEGSPYYTMHKSCDVWDFGLGLDEKVGTRALELIEQNKDKPFFFFVHFAEVDHSGHQHGENSKQYNDALISNDKWTGQDHRQAQGTGAVRQDAGLRHRRPRL